MISPSVASAVEQGTQMLELDCHLTHDGHVVVSHDENLQRQTGHDVTISSLNLQVGGQRSQGHVMVYLVIFSAHHVGVDEGEDEILILGLNTYG